MTFPPLSTENSSSGANNGANVTCSEDGRAGREALIVHTLTAAATVGLTSSIVSILIILATGTYRSFVHRLYLYLSLASAWISIGQFAYWGRTEGYVIYWVLHFAYGLFSYCLLIVWVGVYVFVLVVCRVQLKRERLFVVAVLLAPLTLCWVPATVFGLRWRTIVCDAGLALVPIGGIIVLMCLVSLAALVAVLATLCRGTFGKGAKFPAYHRKALKEVLPVFALVLIVQLGGVLLLVVYAYYAEVGVAIYSAGGYQAIVYALPGIFVVVPVLLVLDLLVCARRCHACAALTGGQTEEPSVTYVTSSKM